MSKHIRMIDSFDHQPSALVTIAYLSGVEYRRVPEAAIAAMDEKGARYELIGEGLEDTPPQPEPPAEPEPEPQPEPPAEPAAKQRKRRG